MVSVERARPCHDDGESANTLLSDSVGDRHERRGIHDSFAIVAAALPSALERKFTKTCTYSRDR